MMSSDHLCSNSSTWRLFCSGSRIMGYAGLNWPGDVLSWLSIVAIMISSLLETFSVTFLQRVIQFHGAFALLLGAPFVTPSPSGLSGCDPPLPQPSAS